MRGEYVSGHITAGLDFGSPPHAWGIRSRGYPVLARVRFTPTCVGNTCIYCVPPVQVPVHPHMRGEYPGETEEDKELTRFTPTCVGNTRTYCCRDRQAVRFTPTCVGNTLLDDTAQCASAVHPHMRGEYAAQMDEQVRDNGSPPHAWGIR